MSSKRLGVGDSVRPRMYTSTSGSAAALVVRDRKRSALLVPLHCAASSSPSWSRGGCRAQLKLGLGRGILGVLLLGLQTREREPLALIEVNLAQRARGTGGARARCPSAERKCSTAVALIEELSPRSADRVGGARSTLRCGSATTWAETRWSDVVGGHPVLALVCSLERSSSAELRRDRCRGSPVWPRSRGRGHDELGADTSPHAADTTRFSSRLSCTPRCVARRVAMRSLPLAGLTVYLLEGGERLLVVSWDPIDERPAPNAPLPCPA